VLRRQLESTLDDRRAGRYGDGETQEHAGRRMLLSFASAAFVGAAVLLEIGAGEATTGIRFPTWAHPVPLTWPVPARVLWWTVVAALASMHRIALHRSGGSTVHKGLAIAMAAPLLVFAGGIASGATWATYH